MVLNIDFAIHKIHDELLFNVGEKMEQQNKLYVGNLSYSIREDDLRKLFEEYGEITEVNLITEGGRSKGFGFITFADDAMAKAAADALNGKEVEGRELTVNVARPKKER